MAAEMIEFAVDATNARGYLATPESGSGPGVVVLQEWWGLVPQITRVADRLADQGYTALAPDLYHGEMAEHTEMDKAGELMTNLPPDRAAKDMLGAVDALLARETCTSSTVGVIGFCMGGLLSLRLSALGGDKISVAAPFYGAPLGDDSIDWSNLSARVEGHFATNDDFFPPDASEALAAELRGMGKDVNFHFYEGTSHGFTNEENPMGAWNAEATETAFDRAFALLSTIS